MKTFLKTILTVIITVCICDSVFAQYITANGIYNNNISDDVVESYTADMTMDTAITPCNGSNTFWGLEAGLGLIKEFEITNNVITYTGNFVPACPGGSLAICNNLNGGALSPTFYAGNTYDTYYWNGGFAWIQVNSSTNFLVNAGGYGNNLYFINNLTSPYEITKFDGLSYTPFYYSAIPYTLADVAVDSVGNSYVITNAGGPDTDSFILSPSGQILKQYSLVVNTYNLFGSFLLNGVFYFGAGSQNASFPNTIIPVTFSNNAAIIGTPLSIPAGISSMSDLASCNPGFPLGIKSITNEQEFSILPNPVYENLIITIEPDQSTSYTLFDIEGKMLIPSTEITRNNTSIDISSLKKGIYIVEVNNKKGVVRRKFARL